MRRLPILWLVLGISLLWSSSAAADLLTGLIAHYPFNGNANDVTANHNNGTVVGATLTQDRFGNPNCAYHFNGIDNYIQVPFQSYLDRDQALGFTVSVWFRGGENNPSGFVDLMDKSHGVPDYNYRNWALQFSPVSGSTRQIGFGGGTGSSWVGNSFAYVPQDGQWHHLGATLSGQTFKIYLDGVLAGGASIFAGSLADSTGDLFFGRHYSEGRYFLGDIGEIRLYQRALTYGEIRQLAGKSFLNKTWDFIDAFPGADTNPNGVWSYGIEPSPGGSFSLFTTLSHNDYNSPAWAMDPAASPPVMWKNMGPYRYATQPGEVSLHPGPSGEYTVARWTSPVTGTIMIDGKFCAGDSGSMGYFIYQNGSEIWSIHGASDDRPFSLTRTVNKGTTLDFMVGEGYDFGNTPLYATISGFWGPSPGTMLLLLDE